MTCCPQASVKRCASVRPRASVTPPGAAGTTIVTGLVGEVGSCGAAAAGTRQAIIAAASHVRIHHLPEVLAFCRTIADFLAPAHGRRDAAIPHNVENPLRVPGAAA